MSVKNPSNRIDGGPCFPPGHVRMDDEEKTLLSLALLHDIKKKIPNSKLVFDEEKNKVQLSFSTVNQEHTKDLLKKLQVALRGDSVFVNNSKDLVLIHNALKSVNAPTSKVELTIGLTCFKCHYGFPEGKEGLEEYRNHLIDHHSRLARHQREVLKMDKSQFPEDGMLCPICSHVCRTPEDQRVHFPSCGASIIEERKKIEAKLKSLNEDTGNTCEKCQKVFKYTIQKKRHKCEAKIDEVNNIMNVKCKNDEVNNITTAPKSVAIADDKFNTPSPSSDQQQKVFSCKICKTKETKLDDIKRHYLLQHYKENLLSYPFLRKNISYPTKCLRAKDGCVKELANLDEYCVHLGLDHGRLFKVIYKDKKFPNSVDIAKELFLEEYLKKGDTNGSMTSGDTSMSSMSFHSVASPAGNTTQPSEQEVLDAIKGKKCNKCDEILNMNNGTMLRHFTSKHFSEEVFGKYPPPKNFGNVFKCTFCDNNNPQEFDGNGKKQRYIRHVGAVHRKVLDFISPEDFKSPQNAPETPQSAKEIRCTNCDEIFPTKESKTLHTCNSLLDKNGISDEGQERTTRASVDHNNEENEQNVDDIHQLPVNDRKRRSSNGSKMSEEPLIKVSKTNTDPNPNSNPNPISSPNSNQPECDTDAETDPGEAEVNNDEMEELVLERDDDDDDGGGDDNDSEEDKEKGPPFECGAPNCPDPGKRYNSKREREEHWESNMDCAMFQFS